MNRRALVASAVCGLLGLACLEVYERRLVAETSGGDPIAVLVVTRDVASGAALARDVLGVRSVPEAYVEERQIRESDLEKIVGIATALKLRAGESVSWTDLAPARPESAELSNLIAPGMRAMAVHANSFDGLLRPGDRVDVFASSTGERPGDAPLLQDIVVLAIGSYTGVDGSAAPGGASDRVTLAGTPGQAALATSAESHGALALALRNPDDRAVLSARNPSPDPGGRAEHPQTGEIEHVR